MEGQAMSRTDRHQRAKPVSYTLEDLNAAAQSIKDVGNGLLALLQRGREVRIDFDRDGHARVRVYSGGGFGARLATTTGRFRQVPGDPEYIDALAQVLAGRRNDKENAERMWG